MENGPALGMAGRSDDHRRFFRGYDDVGLWNHRRRPDATKGGQNPHTHHIKLTNQTVTWNMDGCPVVSPATTVGFQISGTVESDDGEWKQCTL